VSASHDLKQLLAALRLQVLTITPQIALLSRSELFLHGDPADRLIGATALRLGAPLITATPSCVPLCPNWRPSGDRRQTRAQCRIQPEAAAVQPAPGSQADIV
jgi:hypothetical protein